MDLPLPPLTDTATRPLRRGGRSAAEIELPPASPNHLPAPDLLPRSEVPPPPDLGHAPAETAPEKAAVACPRCGEKLIDPAGLGWCKSCGYCRSLEEERARGPITFQPAAPKPSKLGAFEFVTLLMKLPGWVWAMLGGMALVVLITLPPALSLPEDSLPRAVWCTAQILLGVAVYFAGQVGALALVAGDDEKLTFKDALLPTRLWVVAARRLPATRKPLWLTAWGLTLVLSAVFLIGGLSHWMTYLPRNTPAAAPTPAETK